MDKPIEPRDPKLVAASNKAYLRRKLRTVTEMNIVFGRWKLTATFRIGHDVEIAEKSPLELAEFFEKFLYQDSLKKKHLKEFLELSKRLGTHIYLVTRDSLYRLDLPYSHKDRDWDVFLFTTYEDFVKRGANVVKNGIIDKRREK